MKHTLAPPCALARADRACPQWPLERMQFHRGGMEFKTAMEVRQAGPEQATEESRAAELEDSAEDVSGCVRRDSDSKAERA